MSATSRRKFLKQATVTAAAAAVSRTRSHAAISSSLEAHAIPLHRAIQPPGVHAYPSAQSVVAGDSLQFHVSSTVPYQLVIEQLGPVTDISNPRQDHLLHTFPNSAALPQPIHPGSYIHVPKGLQHAFNALTVECWIRPWNLTRLQGILSQEDKDDERGWALGIGKGGYIGFFIGDGISPDEAVIHRTHEGVLITREWFHVVALWDGTQKEIWVNGKLEGRWPFSQVAQPGTHPIRIGAMAEHGAATRFYDGDIAMPAIYQRALTPDEIQERFHQKGSQPARGHHVLACWKLAEEQSHRISDCSRHHRNGRLINHGTWMIGGPAFDGTQVSRFGAYNPKSDPTRGHGLRLASDDLYDCRWQPTHTWRVPRDAKSGLYVGRILFDSDGKSQQYPITFIVRKARTRRKAPALVLCSTSTWLAYNATPFAENLPPGQFLYTEGYTNSHPEAPAFCCYRDHHSGQPSYQFGLRMPWPCAGPEVLYSSLVTGYSHLMRAERYLHNWLDRETYDYDVITDLDLHRDPSLLSGYKTVFINGHSEYWSIDAYQGLDRYLSAGGTAIVLSGNTLFWRTTFNVDGSIMECRKYDERIGGRNGAPIGELYHSHDGQRGSLLRECGYPAWKLVGLECCGWSSVEARDAGVYHVTNPDHPFFQFPTPTELKHGDTFGHSPDGKSHRAVGHEYDVRLQTLVRMTPWIPDGGALPTEPAGFTTLAQGIRANHNALDYFTQPTLATDGVVAEMIDWKRPQGGRVFHAGAIGAGWALDVDPKFQALMRNVLNAFGIPHTKS